MTLPIKPSVSTKTRVEVTTLGNGDGVVDPYNRPVKDDGEDTGGIPHYESEKTKDPTDCVKLVIIKNGQVATKYVSFNKYFGPKYDHLGSVKFREKLIYGPGKRSFKTSVGNHVFDVKWRFRSGATKRFRDLVRKHTKRQNMVAQPSKAKSSDEKHADFVNKLRRNVRLLRLGINLDKLGNIADK